MEATTRPQTTNLFLPEDLDNPTRTAKLAESDLDALRAVAGWIETFIATPNKDLGRPGPVCPFVPGSLERKALWLALNGSQAGACRMSSRASMATSSCS